MTEYRGSYKGVLIVDRGHGQFPFTGNGIVWDFQTAKDLFDYIDKAIGSGMQYVNDRGSLMFKG